MRKSILPVSLLVVCVVGLTYGCASLRSFLNSSTTSLTSSNLKAASVLRAQGVVLPGISVGSDWAITPTKISGKVMSVVLPINGLEDEGIVPFGNGRPDIAPAQSTLYDFDLSQVTTLAAQTIGLKQGFVGGTCNQIIMLFGYFDVEFDQGTTAKKIRFVYGDTDPYVRGDKLMYNPSGETTGRYYWYNTSTESFVTETASRPAYPALNNYVATFSDEIRPNMHYYMLGAILEGNTDYDGSVRNYITLSRSIVEDNDLSFTVDFDVANAAVFRNVASSTEYEALTDAQLIQKFDMKQNTRRWDDSELTCHISFEVWPKF